MLLAALFARGRWLIMMPSRAARRCIPVGHAVTAVDAVASTCGSGLQGAASDYRHQGLQG